MTTVAVPILDTGSGKSPEFYTPQSIDNVICPRMISWLAVGNMMNADSIDQFATGTLTAMDPIQAERLREVDRRTEGRIVLSNSYGQLVAEGLLKFSEANPVLSSEAEELWLEARDRLASAKDFDGGVLRIVLGGMTQRLKHIAADITQNGTRKETALGVCRRYTQIMTIFVDLNGLTYLDNFLRFLPVNHAKIIQTWH